jgi:hypothetical protein
VLRPNWNVGILELWNNGFWENGSLARTLLDREANKWKTSPRVNIPIFHYSRCGTRIQASTTPCKFNEL